MEQEPKFAPNQESKKDNAINIGSKGETETEQVLSNFSNTPFELDGVRFESVEGFWQAIKFPENSEARKKIAGLFGGKAKRAGKKAGDIFEIEYQGQKIEAGSPDHHELMKKAIREKFQQNPRAQELLLDTGNKKITHILETPEGKALPDSKTIPGTVFSQILMDIRKELGEEKIRKSAK